MEGPDIKDLRISEFKILAKEVREEMIDAVSVTGGHLGAGLGVVELTVALHYVFNTPKDLLVWDVGHQAYPHKILTGRNHQLPEGHVSIALTGINQDVYAQIFSYLCSFINIQTESNRAKPNQI